ncbi:MAG: hypothetical protein O7G85_09480, partial [Planctomycetota bacterium]|nr:hypothetical protein [Planctomycetota bacterium]
MNESKHHEDLVQVLRTATEFEAHTKKVVLLDAGIEATVISHGASWAGMIKLSRTEFGAAVWVKQEDL